MRGDSLLKKFVNSIENGFAQGERRLHLTSESQIYLVYTIIILQFYDKIAVSI